tara:strand:+ start:3992 stop:4957 length:966 start_codon:yes stop_codon:yes gene_type:complete
MKKKVLITGCAGFIGYSVTKFLLKKNFKIIGVDSLNDYYNLKLKKRRIKLLKAKNFIFLREDLASRKKFFNKIRNRKFDYILHFAAQPGVRYSLKNPESYIKNNILAFSNILDLAKIRKIDLVYASSSSIYGNSKKFPIKENFKSDPQNIYALTKAQNEESAILYSKLHKLRIIGLRFFTVFGELGRPDMFLIKFFEYMRLNKPFPVYNHGNHYRDFTYIDDVINLIYPILLNKNKLKKNHSVFNVCSGRSIHIKYVLSLLKKITEFNNIKNLPYQKIETLKTHGDNSKIINFSKFRKFTNFNQAVEKTYKWYLNNKNLFE